MPNRFSGGELRDSATGVTVVSGADLNGDMALDTVETVGGRIAAMFGNWAVGGGEVWGCRAVCRTGGTFTKVRLRTGTVAPSALTDLRAGVWDSTGTKLIESANVSATVTAASTIYDVTVPSVMLNSGDIVFIGAGSVGTSINYRGTGVDAVLNAQPPTLAFLATGYAGGALPNIGNARAVYGWFKLVP